VSEEQRPRFVVLGASNVSRGFVSLSAHIRAAHAGPVEILAAHGRGRSFGATSRFLWSREIVSIEASGVWRALERRRATTNALVCDLGNDIAYGVSADVVASWVERTLDRLREHDARIVVVGLPLASLERLGRVRFEIARRLMFPGREMEFSKLIEEAHSLDGRVVRLAEERRIAFVRPDGRWFGLDPIHFRLAQRDEAWRTYLDPLEFEMRVPSISMSDRIRLTRRRPEFRRLFGVNQHREQPCVRFDDGTTVSEF